MRIRNVFNYVSDGTLMPNIMFLSLNQRLTYVMDVIVPL
jgi:hypothetical protein